MKGIIDVQIKHKDGSIETRHEHNVVFDSQAIAAKLFFRETEITIVTKGTRW